MKNVRGSCRIAAVWGRKESIGLFSAPPRESTTFGHKAAVGLEGDEGDAEPCLAGQERRGNLMRRQSILSLSWPRAVCALTLAGVIGIALTVLAGSTGSSRRLVASSGGMTTVEDKNGKAGAVELVRNTPRTKRNMTYRIAIGSDIPAGSFSQVTVDAGPIDGSQGNPQTFDWEEGEVHYLSTIPTGQAASCGAGCQDVFTSWSDGGASSHMITVNASLPTRILARFQRQYFLTMNVNEAWRGSVLPGSGWQKAGVPLSITATANAGQAFRSWTGTGNGNYQGNSNPHNITMKGPITETATFVNETVAVTIASDPPLTGYIIVDGKNITTPQSYSWVPLTPHTVTAALEFPCGPGCRYIFTHWFDGAPARRTISAPSFPVTYTAKYQKQYLLTMKVSSPVGSVKPGTSWHNSGATVSITAWGRLSVPRYDFFSWTGLGSGSYSGTPKPANSAKVTMNGPITETANFKRNPGKADSPVGGPKPN